MRRIYVDLDDVLAETGRMFVRVLEERFGRSIRFDDIESYHLGDSFRLDATELAEFMRVAHQPEPLGSIEPMPGAAETLAGWRASGYRIFVVTGRPPTTRDATLGWLDDRRIPFDEFHFLDKLSHLYRGTHGPTDGALSLLDLPALDFCLAVEDYPGITSHLTEELGIPVALFDRPWNRAIDVPESGAPLVRCHNWSEVQRRFPAPGQAEPAEDDAEGASERPPGGDP